MMPEGKNAEREKERVGMTPEREERERERVGMIPET